MSTLSKTHTDKPATPPAGLLLGLTCALLALLILNLAVFDDLRVDPSAGVLETFTKPQHLSSLVAVLIAAALVAIKHRSAARVAVAVAWIEIAAFTFFHVIPVEVGPSKPYWGDGMGDTLQWVGLLSILAISAAIVRTVRRSPTTAVTPGAARRERAPQLAAAHLRPRVEHPVAQLLHPVDRVHDLHVAVVARPAVADLLGLGAQPHVLLGLAAFPVAEAHERLAHQVHAAALQDAQEEVVVGRVLVALVQPFAAVEQPLAEDDRLGRDVVADEQPAAPAEATRLDRAHDVAVVVDHVLPAEHRVDLRVRVKECDRPVHGVRHVGVVGVQPADQVALDPVEPLVHRMRLAAVRLGDPAHARVVEALEVFDGSVRR